MLKILILALLLVFAADRADAAEMVMRSGSNELRLYDSPCVHAGTLAQLNPQWRDKFKKASAKVNGQDFYACWILDEPSGAVFVIFEDGDQGMWPAQAFKPSGT